MVLADSLSGSHVAILLLCPYVVKRGKDLTQNHPEKVVSGICFFPSYSYWGTGDLKRSVSKAVIQPYIYIYAFSDSFTLQVIIPYSV